MVADRYRNPSITTITQSREVPLAAAKALISASVANIGLWAGDCLAEDHDGRTLSDHILEAAKASPAKDAGAAFAWVVRSLRVRLTRAARDETEGNGRTLAEAKRAAEAALARWVDEERIGVIAKGVATDPAQFAPFAEVLVRRAPKNPTIFAAATEEWQITPQVAAELLEAAPKKRIRVAQAVSGEAILGDDPEWEGVAKQLQDAVLADRSWRRPIVLAKLWHAGGPARTLDVLYGGDLGRLDGDGLTTLVEACYVRDDWVAERAEIIRQLVDSGRFADAHRMGPYITHKRIYYTILKNPTSGEAADIMRDLAAEAPWEDQTKPEWQRELNPNFPGQRGRERYTVLQHQTYQLLQQAQAGNARRLDEEADTALVNHLWEMIREWGPNLGMYWTFRRAEWVYPILWMQAMVQPGEGQPEPPEPPIEIFDLGGGVAHQRRRAEAWGLKFPDPKPSHVHFPVHQEPTEQVRAAVEACGDREDAWQTLFETLESTGVDIDVALAILAH